MLHNGRNCSCGNETHFLLLPLLLSVASSGVQLSAAETRLGEPLGGAPDVGGRGALYPGRDDEAPNAEVMIRGHPVDKRRTAALSRRSFSSQSAG